MLFNPSLRPSQCSFQPWNRWLVPWLVPAEAVGFYRWAILFEKYIFPHIGITSQDEILTLGGGGERTENYRRTQIAICHLRLVGRAHTHFWKTALFSNSSPPPSLPKPALSGDAAAQTSWQATQRECEGIERTRQVRCDHNTDTWTQSLSLQCPEGRPLGVLLALSFACHCSVCTELSPALWGKMVLHDSCKECLP